MVMIEQEIEYWTQYSIFSRYWKYFNKYYIVVPLNDINNYRPLDQWLEQWR